VVVLVVAVRCGAVVVRGEERSMSGDSRRPTIMAPATRRAIDTKVFSVQMSLLDGVESVDDLKACSPWLTRKLYNDVIQVSAGWDFLRRKLTFVLPHNYSLFQERTICQKMCGFPLCENEVTLQEHPFAVSLAEGLVEKSDDVRYCCEACCSSSEAFEQSLQQTSVYMRENALAHANSVVQEVSRSKDACALGSAVGSHKGGDGPVCQEIKRMKRARRKDLPGGSISAALSRITLKDKEEHIPPAHGKQPTDPARVVKADKAESRGKDGPVVAALVKERVQEPPAKMKVNSRYEEDISFSVISPSLEESDLEEDQVDVFDSTDDEASASGSENEAGVSSMVDFSLMHDKSVRPKYAEDFAPFMTIVEALHKVPLGCHNADGDRHEVLQTKVLLQSCLPEAANVISEAGGLLARELLTSERGYAEIQPGIKADLLSAIRLSTLYLDKAMVSKDQWGGIILLLLLTAFLPLSARPLPDDEIMNEASWCRAERLGMSRDEVKAMIGEKYLTASRP
jgi:hypothetical protein